MGGVDCVVFTAGLGENSAESRKKYAKLRILRNKHGSKKNNRKEEDLPKL